MSVDEILKELTSTPWIVGIALVAILVIALGNFTDALEKIHGFFKRARGEAKEASRHGTKLAEEFEELRGNINYCGTTNKLPVVLHALRQFLINHRYIETIEFRAFSEKWLSRYPVVEGIEALNVFSGAEIDLMLSDLKALRLR